MRDLPRREAQVAEDDVLDALGEEGVAVRRGLDDLLLDQVLDHREVVDAERPERVLVLADLAEVLAVAVDDEHLAELPVVDQLLQLLHGRVVEEEMARHEDEPARLGEPDQLLHLRGPHRRRLLDEDVLAGLERRARERVVRRDGGRDHDGVDVVRGEQLVEVARHLRVGIALRELRAPLLARVAEPAQVGQVVEVAREVAAPVAEPGLADAEPRSQLEDVLRRGALGAGRVAEVDDERRLVHERLVVEGGVVGDDDDAVVVARLVRDR